MRERWEQMVLTYYRLLSHLSLGPFVVYVLSHMNMILRFIAHQIAERMHMR